MTASIPVIDVDGADLASIRVPEIARAVDDAFRRTGFCYVTNTGIETGLTESVFDASRRFHALGDEVKQEIAINAFHRGYIAPSSSLIRTSSVARVTRPNLSESFMAMHEVAPEDPAFGKPLQGPNQWPDGLPGFREAVTAYQTAMTDFARRFTRTARACARSAGNVPRSALRASYLVAPADPLSPRSPPAPRPTSTERRPIPTTDSSRFSFRTSTTASRCG